MLSNEIFIDVPIKKKKTKIMNFTFLMTTTTDSA